MAASHEQSPQEYAHTLREAEIRASHLLAQFRKGTPEEKRAAAERIRRAHRSFRDRPVAEILANAGRVQRKTALHVIAVEWGFRAWADAKRHLAATTPDLAVPAWIEDLRGTFAKGYTSEDIDRVLGGDLRDWVGLDMVCVWDAEDEWGTGGSSMIYTLVEDEEKPTFGPLPDGLWEFLLGPEAEGGETVDPRSFHHAVVKPFTPEQAQWEDLAGSIYRVGDSNFARRVAGEARDEDLFVEENGVRVYYTYSENHPDIRNTYHYMLESGEEFDISGLPGIEGEPWEPWRESDDYFRRVIKQAIQREILTADGIYEEEAGE